jgi:hypothetical protein
MMLFRLIEFLKYFFHANSAFGVHSPFAFQWYTRVVKTKIIADKDVRTIEIIRNKLKKSKNIIQVQDFGTGKNNLPEQRKVSHIASHYLNSIRDNFLLRNHIQFQKPQTILELGTSLGISTLYLWAGNKDAKIFTIEGCPNTAAIAQNNFQEVGAKISSHMGDIATVLPELLPIISPLDFVFFDANHTCEATLKYFALCKTFVNENTVFVFDDIYWSPGMKAAWKEIMADPEITLSIDLYKMGFVFFRKNSAKLHYMLKY